ncbi:secondary thiamine-phosphate synthase enzyme YjbQ [Verrucomicrobiota bacterium]
MNCQEEILIETTGHRDVHDITMHVSNIIERSGIRTGTVHVFNVGSTACIGAIEFEPGLQSDISEILDNLIPPGTHYGHEQAWHDGNGHSHLQATLLGPSLTVPITEGRPVLGTWQQIFLLECDVKPRSRRLIITVQGE